jgi:hypothetical protein
MPTSDLPTLPARDDYRSRSERLIAEMRVALKGLSRAQILDWAADTTRTTGRVFVRRGVGFGKAIANAGRGTIDETRGALVAGHDGYLMEHCKKRGAALLGAVKDASKRMRTKAMTVAAMVRNPGQLPEAVVTVVAALVSSGGIDANGGIPDLDLQFGIGAHRSIFTHSIIAGSAVEGSLYGIATLVGLTYRHLPATHDPLWDLIDRNRDRFLSAAAAGASAGIAYHLLIDGTLQPGAYHDLPVHLPLEGHEAILVANASAEGIDVRVKQETFVKARNYRG